MAKYQELITNLVSGETVLIKSNDYYSFLSKKEKKIAVREKQNSINNAKATAEEKTRECEQTISDNRNILNYTLNYDDKVNRNDLYINANFSGIKPIEPTIAMVKDNFLKKNFLWGLLKLILKTAFENKIKLEYENQTTQYNKDIKTFEKEKNKFEKNKLEHNEKITSLKNFYENNLEDGVLNYISMVLEKSKYPDDILLNSETFYDKNSKLFLVDMDLPNITGISNIVGYKHSNSKGIEPILMKNKEYEIYYNNILYQISLRTIHEIFESDYKNLIDLVVFNGWVSGDDKKTGQPIRNCVMTVQVDRENFLKINLSKVDVIECFRGLKGITSGNLVNLSPVKPIMKIDYNDKRIIKSDEVIDNIGDTNLASMDWQDFEVLVRDLFNRMFSNEGCKVEVTQASRDAGVDAIIFDEDPIRGGKYVVQAKRYNNIVPLTAVRDLYGTMINEGAVKGILVTTSYFGKDSLEFVKDKPIKLINGEELIYWFNEHGYNMKIELQNKKKAQSKNMY